MISVQPIRYGAVLALPGPYFQKGGFTLYQGDCLELMAELPEESVDLVFADPPYNLSNGGFSVSAGKRVSVHKGDWDRSCGVEDDFAFHQAWIRACKRLLKPNGALWVSGTYHSIYQCGFALQRDGWHILNEISWYKPNAAPNLSCRVFTASHETLIWARKSAKARQVFNYDDMKEGVFEKDRFKNPGRQMRSVWEIATPPKSEKALGRHPAQKPLKLLERILRASTASPAASSPRHTGGGGNNPLPELPPLVLDPFSGSGTTGIAAARLGRRYIGLEREDQWLALAAARYEAEFEPRKGRGP